MKKRVKAISMIMTVFMLAAVSAGCTNTAKKETANPTDKSTPKSAVKPTLKFLGNNNATFDIAASPVIPVLEKMTGYKVEYEALPTGDEGLTKLLMLAASGARYDMMDLGPAFIDRLVSIKFATSLSDKIKGMPNLMKAVPASSKSWNRVTGEDGVIYAIPQLAPNTNYNVSNAIVVRKDLMDSAGVKMPTTADELYDTLKTLKSKYPDMVPLTVDKAYLGGMIGSGAGDPIQSAFGLSKDWIESNGKVEPSNISQNYKDSIFYYQKLYKENLLDKDFPTMDKAARLAKFTSGKALMMQFGVGDGPGFYSAVEKNIPAAKLEYLPFLKDKAGKQSVYRVTGLEKATIIPKNAENPADALKWIEAYMSNFKEIYIGTEGVEHTFKNGIYEPILPAFATRDSVWWFLPAIDEINGSNYWFARIAKNPESARNYGDVNKLFTPSVEVNTSMFTYAPPNDEAAKINTKLDTAWRDDMIKVVATGSDSEFYDSVVAKWKKDGGTRYTEIGNERVKTLPKK